jgi:hypothetical protein
VHPWGTSETRLDARWQDFLPLESLANKVRNGDERPEDLLALCRLLRDVNERWKSEELLRAASSGDDMYYGEYLRLMVPRPKSATLKRCDTLKATSVCHLEGGIGLRS